MNNIRKNISFTILVLFIMSIVPFPLLADNAEVYKDIFTHKTPAERYIPVAVVASPSENEVPESAAETQTLASLQKQRPVSDSPVEFYSQKITPDVESILVYDGIKLEIPAGAVDKEVTIEIIKLKSAPRVNETIRNVTTGAESYRFLPDGIHFKKNIKISIPFSKALLESETALSNLFTYFFDENSNTWERLPRIEIDKEKTVVVSLTDHFTDMINGTLKMPESPGPVNFDINSIKNLEAANPSSGVMNLKGFTPDSQGSASFQIALNLPQGLGSAYPNLSLSYNSDSPNSWMGRGFDISVPSITTDTKFGLPDYDDSDTYILGGEELVLISGSGFPKSYRPRIEKEFKRIIRKLEGGVDYWEVTDKNGRVQTFGTEEGWIGPDRNNHTKTYTWYLTKETDTNGNFVSYIYDYDSDNKYTYLKEIHYSGNNNVSTSNSGPYKVVFNTSESRPDRRIDARGTFVSKLVRRLDSVDIYYNTEVIRTYEFTYEQNEFGQTVLNSFAELDGSGNEFYGYGFDYNKLSIHDAGTGIIAYDGFGDETIEWGAVSGPTFPGLNQTRTFGIGASLYLGVSVDIFKRIRWFKWGWRRLFSLGVSGGVNYSNTITKSTLLDINGDNLPDAVWKDGGVLRGYQNTGNGFDTSTDNDISLPGLPGLLNRNSQLGYNLGLSVTAGVLSGSLSMQNNWMKSKSSFNDIDGDGRIDYLIADSSKYYRNTTDSFTPTDYGTYVSLTQSENINEDDYLRTYYSQEPLRKWKAYTGGRIEISQSMNLLDSSLVSEDGVAAITYPDGGYPEFSIHLSSDQSEGSDTRSYNIEEGDELFFHMDAGIDSREDDINWDINIAYTDINYFEKMDDPSIIKLKELYYNSLPDDRLDRFYNSAYVQYEDDPPKKRWEYTLKSDWRNYLNSTSLAAVIEYGLFVPARISEDIFTGIFNRASDTEIIYTDNNNNSDDKIIPGEKAALIDSFLYRPEFRDFIRLNNGADNVVRNYLLLESSLSQRHSLFYYTDFSGSSVLPEESGGARSFLKSAPLISIEPKIDITEDNMTPGAELYNGEILLDRIYNETGDEVVATLSLVPDNGALQLVSTGSQGSGVIIGSVVTESAGGISASFLRNGIKHSYSLSNPESVLTGLPSDIYDSEVLDAVTSGYDFVYFPSHTSLSISDYNTIYGTIDVQEDKNFFQTVYDRYPEVSDIEEYILKDPMLPEELDHLNVILPGVNLPANYTLLPLLEYASVYNSASTKDKVFLEEIYSRSPEIPPIERYDLVSGISIPDETRLVLIFDTLSDDGVSILDNPLFLSGNTNSVGIIALSEAEYTDYFEEKADIQSLFNEVVNDDSDTFFILKNNITEAEKNVFETACRQYLRDEIEFPYYEYNEAEGLFTIRSGLNSTELTEISTLFSGLDLSVFTTLNRSLRYYSNAVLPVVYESAAAVSSVDNPVPEGTGPLNHTNPGTVSIPYFDNLGRSSYLIKYIHNYYSESDYSSENLINYPENIYNESALIGTELIENTPEDRIPDSFEIFSGGVAGWYYGVWTGYHGLFQNEKLHAIPPENGPGEVIRPKYFTPMKQNIKDNNDPIKTSVGRDQIFILDKWSLIMDASSYTESDFTEEGEPVSVSYNFAPAIKGNLLHADRNGGDTYFNVPRGSKPMEGGKIGYLSSGKSTSRDIKGSLDFGVGSLSLSLSENEGTSWQYQNVMDINGDRYPDIISYTSDKDGSGSFSVVEGNGTGFGSVVDYSSPVKHLSYSENLTYGFGASPGSHFPGIEPAMSPSGRVKSTGIGTPDSGSGGGFGFSGFNGTAGVSFNTQGFTDVTGDGLPDHIQRSGSGVYNVAINKGDNSFADPAVSFGSGIDEDLYEGTVIASGLSKTAKGISFSNSGSLGTGVSVSIASVGFNASANRTLSQLMDINGDGLSDQVVKKPAEDFFRVRFNMGDEFADDETRIYRPDWDPDGFPDITSALESIIGENSGSFSNLDLPLVGKLDLTPSALPSNAEDNPFFSIINPLGIDDAISYTNGISINLGASLHLNFKAYLVLLRFGFDVIPGINGSYAVSTTSLSMKDINGDGLPDHVLKRTGSDELKIKINSMGMTGLLNKITMPTGGNMDLEYGRRGNTVDMPQNRYVLTKVTKNDGYQDDPTMAGEHSYTETFDYKDGYYDRGERKFYGFHEVSVTKGDGSVTTTIYNNDNYYTKGLVSSTVIENENGITFLEQENSYSLRSIGTYTDGDVKYPYLSTEISRTFDVSDSDVIETEKQYFYDSLGNVIRMEDTGIYSDPDDDITLNIIYSDDHNSNYLMSLPTSLTVKDSTGDIIRKREGTYDGNGNLTALKSYYNDYDFSEYTFGYDANYGNLSSVEDPLGYRKEYTYDNEVHRYVTEIDTSSIYGGDSYTSTLSYDYRYGVETSQTDSNGNTLSKEYDNFGRLKTIISPYDTGTVKAVEYSYLTDTFPWKALTKNKISFDAADVSTMDTYVIIDGLNRIISTAKEGEVYNESGNLHGWNKSGYVSYDNKARPVEEGQTVFEETSTSPEVEKTALRPTLKTYDALDRILTITFPDDSLITKIYSVEGNITKETVTDPLGNITETYKDIRGNIVKLEKKDSIGTLLTESFYSYNVLGELLKVLDAKGSEVTFTYDILGRRLTLQSPETGLTEFEYDKADHLIRKVDANLRNDGASINYIYGTLGRIEKIDYPFMTDTSYTYGAQGDDYNRAGRIVRITDESGSTENYYGELGETTSVTKTIGRLTPLADDKSASFNYTFDYQGRMEAITYPDGEVVSYEYNRGGEVEKVSSVHNGLSTTYIENIGYDEYGQRAYIKYGNGIETKYTYDEDRRWLNNIETKSTLNTLQDIDYTFDKTGNILAIVNISGRYTTNQNYEYDGLYQLTKGEGYFEDREYGFTSGTSRYIQNFSYDSTGNILSKTSSNMVTPSGGVSALNYNYSYTYYTDKPKQAEIIGNLWYLYDGNGNIIEERAGGHSTEGIQGSGTITKNGKITEMNRGIALTRNTEEVDNVYKRTYVWDEENRLKTTIDSQTVEYRYDSTGERTNKMSDDGGETLYFNSMWLAAEDSYDFRQSKNIYLGETRIATRLNMESDPSTGYEAVNTYYYHPDHLGSSNIVTTPDGDVFEHIEYTPYGETWIEKSDDMFDMLPYKFTAKELDDETGLYYYGARYLNPRTSRWISSDPAMDGINWYAYANNNPVKYIDPTGLEPIIADDINGQPILERNYKPAGVDITIIREHDGYGNEFDSTRTIESMTMENGQTLPIGYTDKVGNNAKSAAFAEKYDGMTLPDGQYNGSSEKVKLQKDGSYDSPSYENVLRLETQDPNIAEGTRENINNDMYLFHANQKKGSNIILNTPSVAGCTSSPRGQVSQDAFMSHLPEIAPGNINITIKSKRNIDFHYGGR